MGEAAEVEVLIAVPAGEGSEEFDDFGEAVDEDGGGDELVEDAAPGGSIEDVEEQFEFVDRQEGQDFFANETVHGLANKLVPLLNVPEG